MMESITSVFRSADRRQRMIYLLASLLISGVPLHRAPAQDIPVDIRTQITIFQTLLTFERTQRTDSTGSIRVGIVFQSKFRKSLLARDEAAAHLINRGNKNIPLKVIDIDLDAVEPGEKISGKTISILLVCPLRSFSIRTITELSRTHRVLSMTLVPEYVIKGISIGVEIKGGKPQILMNRAAAKLENADFDARLFNFVKMTDTAE